MSIPFFQRLKRSAAKPVSLRGIETLVGFSLVVWLFGQSVFTYSTIAQVPSVSLLDISKFHAAIAAGCLVAAIASSSYTFRASVLAGVFVALFATLTIWRIGGDARPIILVLFLIASTGLDTPRLARFYVLGASLGMCLVLVVAAMGISETRFVMVEKVLTSAYGYYRPEALGFTVFGILGALLLGWGKSLPSIPYVVSCLVGAGICLTALHMGFLALLFLALGGYAVAEQLRPCVVSSVLNTKYARWVVASLPLVLFLMVNDGAKFFKFPFPREGYASVVTTFGYLAPVTLCVAHARYVLLGYASDRGRFHLVLVGLGVLALTCSAYPLFLEFNCALLLYARVLGTQSSQNDALQGDADGRYQVKGGRA